jgi:hypothetical protein
MIANAKKCVRVFKYCKVRHFGDSPFISVCLNQTLMNGLSPKRWIVLTAFEHSNTFLCIFYQPSTKVWHVFHDQTDLNLGLLQRFLLLCLSLQQFKLGQVHHTNLFNLFYSIEYCHAHFLMHWEMVCKTCSKLIFRYNWR